MIRCIISVIALLCSCSTQQFGLQTSDGRVPHSSEQTAEESENTVSSKLIDEKSSGFEVFPVAVDVKKLDMLIVVDNSTSMRPVNDTLKDKIGPLLSEIKESDWQIAVTTSTFTDCLRGIMKKGESDLGEFKEILGKVHPTYMSVNDLLSSNNEQVVKMAKRALEGELPIAQNVGHRPAEDQPLVDVDCSGEKQSWLRPGSLLVVLMITDEDADDPLHPEGGLHVDPNRKKDDDYRCKESTCIDEFYDYLSTIGREPHVGAKIYGILDTSMNDIQHPDYPSYFRSNRYLEWRDKKDNPLFDFHHELYRSNTNELDFNVIFNTRKLNDFDVILKKISADSSSSLRSTFALKNTYEKTARVTLTKSDNSTVELSPQAYIINGKTLKIIDPEQLAGATQVKIQH